MIQRDRVFHFRFVCVAMVLSCAPLVHAEEPAPKSYRQMIPGSKVAFDMVGIPAGTVRIGSDAEEAGRGADEGPTFEVAVDAFWMGRHEVTWGEYKQFMGLWDRAMADPNRARATGWDDPDGVVVSIPSEIRGLDMLPVVQAMGYTDRFPATFMTQFAARQYCKWLSIRTSRFYRLPTEAEWEYAARAGSQSAWSFGGDRALLSNHAWYLDSSEWDDPLRGHPDLGSGYRTVASLKPNRFGLYDMHGNVAEWCIDAYDPSAYKRFAGKRVAAADAVRWPKTIHPRVLRGGHWDSEASTTRSAARLGSTAAWSESEPSLPKSLFWHTDAPYIGFRIVRPVVEPSEKDKRRHWDARCKELRDLLRAHHRLLRIKVEPAKATTHDTSAPGSSPSPER